MSNKRIAKIKKKYDQLTLSLVVIAIFFMAYGLYHYLFLGTSIVTHPKVPTPSLSDGSVTIFFGIIFLGLALYRIIRREKLIEQIDQMKRSNRK